MPALYDQRLETFASLLVSGLSAASACRASGFSSTTAASKAAQMAKRPEVQQRIAELQVTAARPAPRKTWPLVPPAPPVVQPVARAAAVAQVAPSPSRAVVAKELSPQERAPSSTSTSRTAPSAVLAIDPPTPLPRIDLARAGRDGVKAWSMAVLHELIQDAHNARDRRAIATALSEVSKIAGTYAPTRMDHVHVSALDGLTRDELLVLLEVVSSCRVSTDGSLVIDGKATNVELVACEGQSEFVDDNQVAEDYEDNPLD